MNGLQVSDIDKLFDSTVALSQVSFDLPEGQILSVLGPSGCGKSTLLHVIAGLVDPDAGTVLWNDQNLANVPPHKRNFGLMFQEFALFPHLNVSENVAFGLRMRDMPVEECQRRTSEMLELVGLSGFGDRNVDRLSGGERQRVALARSLAPQPELLMLDEPFGSLDRTLRERLMLRLPEILQQMNQTAIYVTHDQEEAFAVSGRVLIMQAGRVVQMGTPEDIYCYPASLFVARFLGLSNLLDVSPSNDLPENYVQTAIGSFNLGRRVDDGSTLLLRTDQIRLNDRGGPEVLAASVDQRSFRGAMQRLKVDVDGVKLTFDFPTGTSLPEIGEKIDISFDPQEAFQVLS